MPILFRDYETRSTLDLRDVGAWRYSCHPTTDVWCCTYAVDDGEIKLWIPGDPIPAEFIEAANNPEWRVSAFNDSFERRIEQHIMAPRYGWPTVPIERHICTQAASLAMALPAKLETVAIALELEHQKDAAGARLMKQMARPRAPKPHEDPNGIYWFDDPERLARLYAYCKQDVATERALSQHVPSLSASEQALWLLDAGINDRGIPIDRDLLDAALTAAKVEHDNIREEFLAHTGGSPGSINQTAQLIAWLRSNGCELKDIRSATLKAKLEDPDLPPVTRRVIELRLGGAHASVAKLKPMRAWCDSDGRLRGAFRYHGASTGRFTSLGVQLQNLKRPETDNIDDAIDAVKSGDLSSYAQPMAIVGDLARAIIAAAPGHRFIAADFSGVESRITAWVSGQQDKVEQWAKYDSTGDAADEPYFRVGVDHFDLPADTARNIGKIGDLAFGYMGSIGAWHALAPKDTRSDKEIKALQQRWRNAHPETVRFWRALNRSAVNAVRNPGAVFQCKRVSFRRDGSFLKLILPSGRELSYPFPRVDKNDRGDDVVVFKDNAKGRFVDCRNGHGAYGGLWIENVVQAIARDVFAEAMPELERAGYPIVLHVHDEIVSEVPEGFGTTDEFLKILTTPPAWAKGLPIAAKVRNGPRFSKASKPADSAAADQGDIVTLNRDEAPPWEAVQPAAGIEPESRNSTPPPPPPQHANGNGHNGKPWENYDFSDYQRGEDRSGSTATKYVYLDHNGAPYLRVNRKTKKDGKKGFPQESWTGSGWEWGTPEGAPIPYRLPELLAANPEEPIWICEGEKDADNVAALGLIATTNSGGAGQWTSNHCKWLVGKLRVNILADNDDSGRAHAEKVAALLTGIVPEIVIIHFNELAEHGDVSDWLEQGYGRADLLERAAAAKANPTAGDRLNYETADTVKEKAVNWFWPERLARGKINLLAGLPDLGKGQIAAFLAAAATADAPLPCGEGRVPQGNVIWFNAEDDTADTIKPRLMAAGADLKRVHLVTGATVGGKKKTFSLATDLPLLRKMIAEIGNVVLVIIDPVGSYMGVGKIDSNRGIDVRGLLEPLKCLAEDTRTCILGIMHFNKKQDVTSALLRISDSIAFSAVPRSVYAVIHDPENPDARLFLRVKTNVARSGIAGLRFVFTDEKVGFDDELNKEIRGAKIVWTDRVEITANEALDAAGGGQAARAKKEAKEFLEDMLSGGPVASEELFEMAKQQGISRSTLRRAQKDLKIKPKKGAGSTAGSWTWELPGWKMSK
jgi:DNA polymerase bacteriophage-type